MFFTLKSLLEEIRQKLDYLKLVIGGYSGEHSISEVVHRSVHRTRVTAAAAASTMFFIMFRSSSIAYLYSDLLNELSPVSTPSRPGAWQFGDLDDKVDFVIRNFQEAYQEMIQLIQDATAAVEAIRSHRERSKSGAKFYPSKWPTVLRSS